MAVAEEEEEEMVELEDYARAFARDTQLRHAIGVTTRASNRKVSPAKNGPPAAPPVTGKELVVWSPPEAAGPDVAPNNDKKKKKKKAVPLFSTGQQRFKLD